MKDTSLLKCPDCESSDVPCFKRYETINNGTRKLYQCANCQSIFSETRNTAMEGIKSPISRVACALKLRSEGLGLRATGRVLQANKRTITEWERRFADQKESLMLYAFCHEFVSLTFEGDELYTIVGKRTAPMDSKGWTAVIMERASRFIVEQRAGEKNASLFKSVMATVCEYCGQTNDFTFLSDGERRYGNILFELCCETLRTGKPGRPRKVLPPGVRVRIKNKGSQKHKKGPKRQKYQAPQKEHPDTSQDLKVSEIHANHVEAQNAALRRRNSAYRRRTNTYAKTEDGLQRTLDVHQLIHNFVRPHWTTGVVPAVALGIMTHPMSLEEILTTQKAA